MGKSTINACISQCLQGSNAGQRGNESIQEWQNRWLSWSKEWVDSLDPLTNGFLDKLKLQFDGLEKLQGFVAELKAEAASVFEG